MTPKIKKENTWLCKPAFSYSFSRLFFIRHSLRLLRMGVKSLCQCAAHSIVDRDKRTSFTKAGARAAGEACSSCHPYPRVSHLLQSIPYYDSYIIFPPSHTGRNPRPLTILREIIWLHAKFLTTVLSPNSSENLPFVFYGARFQTELVPLTVLDFFATSTRSRINSSLAFFHCLLYNPKKGGAVRCTKLWSVISEKQIRQIIKY